MSCSRIMSRKSIAALVSMLGCAGQRGAELAAITIVRLAQGNPTVSVAVAEVGGVMPLVRLLTTGSGAAQQAASALAELCLVGKNRDAVANAGGILPLITLLNSRVIGTPETAARALAHLARSNDEEDDCDDDACSEDSDLSSIEIKGARERRAAIMNEGGVERLIAMLDGSNLSDTNSKLSVAGRWNKAKVVMEEMKERLTVLPGQPEAVIKVGMQEQAAAALAEFADDDLDMQDAIIEGGGLPKLLQLVHEGRVHKVCLAVVASNCSVIDIDSRVILDDVTSDSLSFHSSQ